MSFSSISSHTLLGRGRHTRLIAIFVGCLLAAVTSAEPLRVVSISDAPHDATSRTGADVLLNHLEARYAVSLVHIDLNDPEARLDALEDCEVIFFHLQPAIPDDRIEELRSYLQSNRPLVALRGAAHAFGSRFDLDREVLGAAHLGMQEGEATTRTRLTPAGRDHPIFDGVEALRSRHRLYRFEALPADAEALMVGTVPGAAVHPVAWVREQGERRIFYASIGGPLDFENDAFKRMVANALYWAAGKEPERKPLPDPGIVQRSQQDLTVSLRSRSEAEPEGVVRSDTLPLDVAALMVVNIFDTYWCPSVAAQMDALAVKVNELVSIAREAGMLIVHVPSQTEGFYDKHPASRRVNQIAGITVEGNYPIVASPIRQVSFPPIPLSNADCPSGGRPYPAWTRQHPAIEIHDEDSLSAIGQQLYSYLLTEGIDTLFYVGPHANTRLIDRNYGMQQMYEWGMDCILIRDLTDIQYNPGTPPEMSHEAALQKVIEHIETHLAPTTSSQELIEALRALRP